MSEITKVSVADGHSGIGTRRHVRGSEKTLQNTDIRMWSLLKWRKKNMIIDGERPSSPVRCDA